MGKGIARVVGLCALAAVLGAPALARGATITEFPGLAGPDASPEAITRGPDGALYFTQNDPPRIGRISTTGAVSGFSAGISEGATLAGITLGPDGNIWFTESEPARIGRLNPTTGVITEVTADDDFFTTDSGPEDIVTGPDGALWFTENTNDSIGRINPSNLEVDEFDTGDDPTGGPNSIASGPDGNLWFTLEANPGAIGRMTPQGAVTEFNVPSPNSSPEDITAGPDGNLWFTESALAAGRIGRITPAGVITEFSAGITPLGRPDGIAAGADGNLWFTERGAPGRVGRITPAGAVTEYATGITLGSEPHRIANGPDGNLWFTETVANQIGRVAIQVPPLATTGGVLDIAAGRATVAGTVNPSGLPTTYTFEYGTTTAYGSRTTAADAGNGEAATDVTASLTGLASPGALYHYRITATNSAGTAVGEDRTFTASSEALPPPSVTAAAPGPVSSTSITLNGRVDPGAQSTTAAGGCRSPEGRVFQSARRTIAPSDPPRTVAFEVRGLKPFTEYTCRIAASNASGVARGEDQRIRTNDAKLVLKVVRRLTGEEGKRTRLRYRISIPGTVTIRIARVATKNAQGSRTRRFRREARPGRNTVVLPALSAGRYRIRLIAVSRDGQRRSARSALRVPRSARDPFFTG